MILSRWQCARRCPLLANQTIHSTLAKGAPRHLKASTMYTCKTCNLQALCRSCTIMCHAQHGHVIGARPFNAPRQLCQCGLGPCSLLLCIIEHIPVNTYIHIVIKNIHELYIHRSLYAYIFICFIMFDVSPSFVSVLLLSVFEYLLFSLLSYLLIFIYVMLIKN